MCWVPLKSPADSCRGSDRQILHFKDHVHAVGQLDPLRVGKTQHLVIIENSVHILNPQSVHWSVANHPFVIFSSIL